MEQENRQQQLSALRNEQKPTYVLDALYCLEEGAPEDYLLEEEDAAAESFFALTNRRVDPSILFEKDLVSEDEELASLLQKERENELCESLQSNPLLGGARREAVEWMLKVNAHYSFSATTAVLAVDYLDRFLSRFHFQIEKPWMTQLVAVACLSLAAKVEETKVPLLLDFQVEDSKYVFEAKTIMRMEVIVLSELQWGMNPVTAISFLHYFTRKLGLNGFLSRQFLSRCEDTLLSLILDSRFVSYLPSVVATATVLHAVNSLASCPGSEFQNHVLGILGTDKDKVEDCYRLVSEASGGHENRRPKRKLASIPGSPSGVMDLSFSSDSSNDSWAAASSVSSSPEPLTKKSRVQDQQLQTLNVATTDLRCSN